jgi:flagellar hook assembly protein FlgD
MPTAGRLRIAVHDLRGRQVRVLRDGWQAAGQHRIAWDGRDSRGREAASGVYYVRAASDAGPALLKVTLVR